ncbi:alpha/beta fold hydrolase [Lacimicrobium alkaliphilum]|uniref:Alpha/beta hydrolase n=1 Tax=Lacimicrobium alkaliphilum TaxID=1526571 RepID=A0ABQ1RH02_9ALTE|nr:alpha/beta fold hydrolase [Lacimicrobium alkaliphilum]GGD67466.1 alpha/beta hydrolase [Lacimicrobium alkaliphilum]
MNSVSIKSLYLPGDNHRLHLCQLSGPESNGQAVLMIHGSMENGRIFYNHKGKGFGSFLARQGFDVYVLDLRGRGLSEPVIGKGHKHGQHESICEDIPRAMAWVKSRTEKPFHCVAHSWGGVMLMACLIRQPHWIEQIGRQLLIGSKRTIRIHNPERWLKIDLFWYRLAPLIARLKGYLPVKALGIGADNETRSNLSDISHWVRCDQWKDRYDEFDYHQAAQSLTLPPTWFITGKNDQALGHYQDMCDFVRELDMQEQPCGLIGRKTRYRHDYGHIDILTHEDGPQDHFPVLSRWLHSGALPEVQR